MAKNILFARPHPFIVSEMTAFLENVGYEVSKLESSQHLNNNARNSFDAVISLAVTSSAPESAKQIFVKLRLSMPRVPVLFATISPLNTLRASLERLAKIAGIQAPIPEIDTSNAASPVLGLPDTFLYLSKDDLIDQTKKEIALTMLKRHFH